MLDVSCQEIMKHTLAMDFIIFGINAEQIREALVRIQKMLMHLSLTEFCAIQNSPQCCWVNSNYLYSFNLTCILFSPLHTFVFDELLYLVQIGEEQNKNFLFCIVFSVSSTR